MYSPRGAQRGDGCWLISESGDRYLDCASGIAVNTLGHSHPRLVAALIEQAGKLWHTSNLYRIPGQEVVAKLLASLSGLDQVFFCNSGAEATEAAVKIARRAAYEKGEPERVTILCAEGAFVYLAPAVCFSGPVFCGRTDAQFSWLGPGRPTNNQIHVP